MSQRKGTTRHWEIDSAFKVIQRAEPRDPETGDIVYTPKLREQFDGRVPEITDAPKLTCPKNHATILSSYAKAMCVSGKSTLVSITVEFPKVKLEDRYMSYVYGEQAVENLMKWAKDTYGRKLYFVSTAMEAHYGAKDKKKGSKRDAEGNEKEPEPVITDGADKNPQGKENVKRWGICHVHFYMIIANEADFETDLRMHNQLTITDYDAKPVIYGPLSDYMVGTPVDVHVKCVKGGWKKVNDWFKAIKYNAGKFRCKFAQLYGQITYGAINMQNWCLTHMKNISVRYFIMPDPDNNSEFLQSNRDKLNRGDSEGIYHFHILDSYYRREQLPMIMDLGTGKLGEVRTCFLRLWDWVINNELLLKDEWFYKSGTRVPQYWSRHCKLTDVIGVMLSEQADAVNSEYLPEELKQDIKVQPYANFIKGGWKKWNVQMGSLKDEIVKMVRDTRHRFPTFNPKNYHNWICYTWDEVEEVPEGTTTCIRNFHINPDTAEVVEDDIPLGDTVQKVFFHKLLGSGKGEDRMKLPKWCLPIIANAKVNNREGIADKWKNPEIVLAILGCLLRKRYPFKWRVPYFIGEANCGKTTIVKQFISCFRQDEVGDFTSSDNFGMMGLVNAKVGYHEEFNTAITRSDFLKYTEGSTMDVNIKHRDPVQMKFEFPKIYVSNHLPGYHKKDSSPEAAAVIKDKLRKGESIKDMETPVDVRLRYVWFKKLKNVNRNLVVDYNDGHLVWEAIKYAKDVFGVFPENETTEGEPKKELVLDEEEYGDIDDCVASEEEKEEDFFLGMPDEVF